MDCNSVALQLTKEIQGVQKGMDCKRLAIHLGYQRVIKYDEVFHLQPRVWKVATNLKWNSRM